MKLFKQNEPVVLGERVVSFRGERATVTGWAKPRHSASTGRVYVKFLDGTTGEYYPSVFGLKWRDAD